LKKSQAGRNSETLSVIGVDNMIWAGRNYKKQNRGIDIHQLGVYPMNGRSIKLRIILLAGVLAAGLWATTNGATQSVLGPEAARTISLVDGHFHVMPWMEVGDVIGHMDQNGIRWAGGAAALGGPDRNREVTIAMGSRYIRATGQGQWLSLKQEAGIAALENADHPGFQKRLAPIEADLRDHGARVIGEIHVNTLQSAANQLVQHKIKADAPTLKALLNLAGKYGRPLNLHAEWDPDTAREFQRLAESNRSARLILSHCGSFAGASEIRELFDKHPNVSCDLSFRSPPQLRRKNLERTVFDSQLRDDWKQLIENFSERFIVGVDDVYSWDDYQATVNNIRLGLLAHLSAAVAENVAYKNAQAWFGLE
jgi:hypothetical protein